jgi:hypothetical protein
MAADPEADDDADDSQWRFSLSDLEDEDEEASTEKAREDVDEDSDSNIAGSLDFDAELEAQRIDLENAAFVLVGVLLAIAVIFGFVTLLL